MRSKRIIEKAHKLRKRVRREKSRLRRRRPKKHSRYERMLHTCIELPSYIMTMVVTEAKRTHTSCAKVVKKALNKMMEKFDGIPKEPNSEVDKDTEQ